MAEPAPEAARLYAPFEAPYRMTMGLSGFAPADWLEIDGGFAAEVALKRRLLAERRDQVLRRLPGSEAAEAELLTLLAPHLARHHSRHFALTDDTIRILPLRESLPLGADARPPLERAALLVQEDLCLLQRDAQAWRLTAAAVCFPTRWDLPSKMGLPLEAIHAPVPGFADRLASATQRFFDHLSSDRPVQRLNWSLLDSEELFLPSGHGRTEADPAITAENAGDKVFLRVERQTLSRLRQSGAVLFTIRVHRWPLRRLRAFPEAAARLKATLETLPPELQRYKSLPVLGAAVLGYLARIG
ncbi:MAG: DUF3445 domain-containing protein [Alphaproteobacteria bacterium]|nr:DUF3445 domain-containing protein [Alphaproteobacteria bacterium]